MKIDALIPEMFIDSSKRKWFKRNLSKVSSEALKFLEIFKSFIATKKCSDIDLNDFIVTLRTHLLMQKFSMSHINSYKRKKLNNESPHSIFSKMYGKDTVQKLGVKEIEPNEESLSKNLQKK